MDYFQLEEALELLEQIQPLVIDLPRLRAKLLDISRDLEILQLFILSPNGESECECEQLDLLSAFPSSQVAFEKGVKRVAWTAAVSSVHLLVAHPAALSQAPKRRQAPRATWRCWASAWQTAGSAGSRAAPWLWWLPIGRPTPGSPCAMGACLLAPTVQCGWPRPWPTGRSTRCCATPHQELGRMGGPPQLQA